MRIEGKEFFMRGFRTSLISLLAGTLMAAFLTGCSSKEEKKPESTETPEAGMPKAPQFHGTIAGITWSFPNTWKVDTDRPMRVATYIVDPVEGDVDSAECAVFYFGPEYGGSKEDNLDRWISQFEDTTGAPPKDAVFSDTESDGMKINIVELAGTYKVASGPMMQVREEKEGYRLYGAIVEGPEGLVFFKMTGPDLTVTASRQAFLDMLGSIKKIPT
jgi:hypothetical protein